MIKPIQIHIEAISKTFSELGNGKFLKFFIPGIVVAGLFWQIFLISDTIESSFSFLESVPLIGSYLNKGIAGTFSLFNFILEQVFVFFILTLLSPFNTILSEKVDTSLTGQNYSFDLMAIISDLIRMIFIVLIAILLELLVMGLYWLISGLIPFDFIDQIAYFLIAAFFYGFSFYDYSLERYHIGVSGSIRYAFSNILLVALTGTIFLALYSIPYIGVIISPVITTIIATIVYIKSRNNVELNSKQV
jgi:CysZ protein